ncbi:MAG: hypothetical protein KGJ78_04040 [Alphaproteobacteria bacterium]|nr:hypothetical protein [Alphaproteobacteria bacterium]
MTDSLLKRLVFAALAAPLLAAPLLAQWSSDKPPVLSPDDYPPVADAPASQQGTPPGNSGQDQATSGPRSLNQPPADEPTALPAVGPAVEVGSLGAAEGTPVGTLDAANGGLDETIWSGSEKATVETLLQRAPLASTDPALRSLVKQVALTRAAAPPGSAKHAFVTMRLRKLLDAGMVEDAGAIAAQASVVNDMEFARVQADALLFANRAGDVCGNATSARLTEGDPFWLELRAYCAASSGDEPTADLTRQVLDAQGDGDPAFEVLYSDAINHQADPPPAIAEPTAMHMFLLQQAGLAIPADMAQKLGPAADAVLLHNSKNSPQSRVAAAERLARIGAVPAADLRVIADAQDIPLTKVANATTDAPTLPFFAGQMVLRRAATIEPRPDAKAALVYEAMNIAEKAHLLPLAANLQSDLLVAVKPDRSDPALARLLARALLLAGDPRVAARWVPDGDVLQAVADLEANDPANEPRLQAAYIAFATGLMKNPADPDPDRSYKALLLGLADVLGRSMPQGLQVQSLEAQSWDGRRPEPQVMRTIEQAAMRPDRRGEAVLRIVDAAHGVGLRDLAPDVTVEFVRLLESMGLADGARRLAFEALAEYVPPPPLPPQPAAAAQ